MLSYMIKPVIMASIMAFGSKSILIISILGCTVYGLISGFDKKINLDDMFTVDDMVS